MLNEAIISKTVLFLIILFFLSLEYGTEKPSANYIVKLYVRVGAENISIMINICTRPKWAVIYEYSQEENICGVQDLAHLTILTKMFSKLLLSLM